MSTELFHALVALAIGFLIGLERGWHERKQADGMRVAGLRSFALISLSGYLAGHLHQSISSAIVPITFAGLIIIVAIAHWRQTGSGKDSGVTTLFTMIITFSLGLMVSAGETTH